MTMTKTQLGERLDALKARKAAARDQMANARAAKKDGERFADKDMTAEAEGQYAAARHELEIAQGLENLVLRQIAGDRPDFGSALIHNLDAQHTLQEIAGTSAPIRNNVMVGPVMDLDSTLGLFGGGLYAAPVTIPDGTSARSSGFEGIQAPPTPALKLLDLWPSKPLDNRTTDYLRRNGSIGPVDPTAEGAIKPEQAISYTPATAGAETFADWVKAPRQAIDDIEELLPDLQVALRHGVLGGVEKALVRGVPAFDIDGLTNVTGTLAPDVTGATLLADKVAIVLRDLRASGVEPTFVAVSPTDYTTEVMAKATGSGEYLRTIVNGRFVFDPVPLVQSTALAPGEIIAGDSVLAGYVGIRQPPVLLVGTESDDLIRNMVTALVEMRATPVLKVPAAIAYVPPPGP
jgi:hypothetical protein